MKCNENVRKLRGERLKSVLKRYGMKQADLTRNTTIHPQTVSAWVNGAEKGYLSAEKAKSLVQDFFPDVRIEYLLGTDDYMTNAELEGYKNFLDDSKHEYLNELIYRIIEEKGWHIKHRQRLKELDGRPHMEVTYTISDDHGKVELSLDEWNSIRDNIRDKVIDFCEFLIDKHIISTTLCTTSCTT